ncbi:YIP1 family protein [Neptunicoccus sediminis]|uniref:YIP1 family protein n=1 Tax=Neptunicoccus sediminis TaxID=1892596 RepID=UPI000845DD4D|nr:YIP1 family protein [Neptunicoccus sediminis]
MTHSEDEFEAGNGVFQLERNGLVDRVSDAWRDMRSSTRRLLRERPSEGRLIFYVLVSDMVFFASWSLKTLVAPASIAGGIISADKIGLLMMAALMLRTALMYLFSLVVQVVARIFNGAASWKETRTAVFWGAFVSAPFGLAAAVIAAVMGMYEPALPFLGNKWLALPVYWLGLIPFVWYIAAGTAEAHKFRMTSPTFMAMSLFALVLTVATLLVGAGDMIG